MRRVAVYSGLMVRFILPVMLCCGVANAGTVQWQSGRTTEVAERSPDQVAAALTQLASRAPVSHIIVHLKDEPGPEQKAELAASGIELLNYLGDRAFFARVQQGIDAGAALATGHVVDVGPIDPVNKLSPRLLAGTIPDWAVVGTGEDAGVVARLHVMFHRDFDTASLGGALVDRHHGTLISRLQSINVATIDLPSDRIEALAAEDAVMWIGPVPRELEEENNGSREVVGIPAVNLNYNVQGSGVLALVYDSGQVSNHVDFSGRLTIGMGDTDSVTAHATHVAGTIGGSGQNSGGTLAGMAPQVSLVSFGQTGSLGSGTSDIEQDFTTAIQSHGADLANTSLGTGSCDEPYDVLPALLDEIVRGSLGSTFPSIWSAGNAGNDACGPWGTVTYPKSAKNTIAVANLYSDTLALRASSSRGPVVDGRLKPEFAAAGCQVGGDGGIHSTNGTTAYSVMCGTSMAAPAVTGVSALLLEYYRQNFGGHNFRPSTLKTILASSAADVEEVGPDFKTGYGLIRADFALDLLQFGTVVEETLGHGEVYNGVIEVAPGTLSLKVSLAWDDPAAAPNVTQQLVNDLDLRIIGPGGAIHLPWTLDPQDPTALAVKTRIDSVNPLEQVEILNPTAGQYVVEVVGTRVVDGPSQPFGLATPATMVGCTSTGIVSVGATRTACETNASVTVADCDLNQDSGQAETIQITASSPTEPGGETIDLVETSADSGVFEGLVPVSTTDGNGVLQVTDGDLGIVTYLDADDGQGGVNVPVTKQVLIDCTAPDIVSLTIEEIFPDSAFIELVTSEVSALTLRYGADCAALDRESFGLLGDTHQLQFLDIDTSLTTYYTIELRDLADNTILHDNGGQCYSFSASDVNYHTEDSPFDLVGKMVTFTPDGGSNFYSQCTEDLPGYLPIATTDAVELAGGEFILQDGKTATLYGESHSSLWPTLEGTISFSGSASSNNTLLQHFTLPSVSVLRRSYVDATSRLFAEQLSDRVVFTWEVFFDPGDITPSSFQAEMFFDGRIRISWLAAPTGQAIIGLSPGGGIPPLFTETDLSESGTVCLPRAPLAPPVFESTPIDTAVPVFLTADDDGLPAPPDVSFIVVDRPLFGSLVETSTGFPVETVPFEMQPGSNELTYTPVTGHYGVDRFDYLASDGGLAPDGGPSASAAIQVDVNPPVVIHEFLVDDTNPGWFTDPGWAFGQPTGGGNVDPTSGFTGNNVYGYNLNGNYESNSPVRALLSPPIDLSLAIDTRLEFMRWLNVDDGDTANVFVGSPACGFHLLWVNPNTEPTFESEWSQQSYDASAVDGCTDTRLRWGMGPTDSSAEFGGWNIDDIRVWGRVLPACSGNPGEATFLRSDSDKQTLAWSVAPTQGGTTPRYDLLRAGSAQDFDVATCLESDDTDAVAIDTDLPSSGSAFMYLIRAVNNCGTGSLGQDSDGGERTGATCP